MKKKVFLLLMNRNWISSNPTSNILSLECKTFRTAIKKEKEARWIFEQGKGQYVSRILSSDGKRWDRNQSSEWVES